MTVRVLSLPEVRVRINDRPMPAGLTHALVRLHLVQQASAPTQCTLEFGAPMIDEIRSVVPGTPLSVQIGSEDSPCFNGEICRAEKSLAGETITNIRLIAQDIMVRLSRRYSRAARAETTTADFVQSYVSDLGLAVSPDRGGRRTRRTLQFGQTDLEFLRSTMARAGQYFHVHGRRLNLFDLNPSPTPMRIMAERAEILAEGAVSAEVQMFTWNPLQATALRGSARRTSPSNSLPIQRSVGPLIAGSIEEADLLAEVAMAHDAAVSYVVNGVTGGRLDLRPGVCVEVAGADVGVVLTLVEHTIDSREGFLTRFSSKPPSDAPVSQGVSITSGRVTRIDDPDGLGRVKVELASFGDLETDWLEVALPGLGRDHGLHALPQPDDCVLVALLSGEPSQGAVLGGLTGDQRPANDFSSPKQWTLRSPAGHRVTLDDSEGRIRLEHAKGSFVELDNSSVKVHAAGALTLEAPGQPMVLRAASIDFEQG